MTAGTTYEPAHVSVRTKLSALWTAMLFIFAYVDIFSLYRSDFRADLEGGEIAGFTVNQAFLLAVTIAGGAIGEWNYYVLASAVEVALLATVVYYAWTWPKLMPAALPARDARPRTP